MCKDIFFSIMLLNVGNALHFCALGKGTFGNFPCSIAVRVLESYSVSSIGNSKASANVSCTTAKDRLATEG